MTKDNKTGIINLSEKQYDIAQRFVRYILPAVATLYSTLAALWGLPYPVEIVGTITAFTLLLGIVLGVSSSNYDPSQGAIEVDTTDPEKDTFTLKPDAPISELVQNGLVTFKVVHSENSSQE